ncbi:molecular chaperone DnaJ [bacterium (Candidatus Blackallbacteria) CG17_big_fil_post_rev_8_21_14_2_50_48_46]|uniref:Molecular chaperone DnaJ n=1 Tax=bacterium (Candidatus Blackallbacteria) CG17_big_fil_post_rev_8_21_14_2_50_48_46 TaxID=2014261 RepID=A0A2M7FXY6_9BACT|nr:MAG: molecular chaperone DnaJ [bacterium (Candidatus Blackallbacteria) CG18_big_fil_WC_8_21_14_2_50_49_26]PIW14042.1 MAG: molecular chaperone DnaJ [bacterium (Candidatus Blackallbacteria) CG17_big_fil_post_rev_8_21_14_2_50_48_46]PIW50738.1 MAG: molecular chaperone DnaJ [bacterium (Candidatus Blackallbacteria) CG13_big_fil_rev_8_21_14_2_50_49_14]
MKYTDYYASLGIEKGANEKEVRQAYRRLAKDCHPDTHPGDSKAEEKFKQITEAYEVLSDPEKRSRYDQLGANWQDFSDFAESFGAHQRNKHRVEYNSELFDLPFSDFFETFFGDQAGGIWDKHAPDLRQEAPSQFHAKNQNTANSEISYTAQVTLEEVLNGTKRRIQLHEDDDFKTLEVKIPPGVKEGSKVRIGNPEHNLFLEIHLRPHPLFSSEGLNLHGKLKIMDYEAMLGASKPVGTLTGNIQMKIPPGSQSGQVFRVKGQGLPQLKNPEERGDLMITLEVKTSRNLGEEERQLIERFQVLREAKPL